MVTASKVQNQQRANHPPEDTHRQAFPQYEDAQDEDADGATSTLLMGSTSIWGNQVPASHKDFVAHQTSFEGDESEDDESIPLNFGEQLVLETYMRYKGRRYDRKRQDELSKPRRKRAQETWGAQAVQGNPAEPGGQSVAAMSREEVDKLVARLGKPKKKVIAEQGNLVAMHSQQADVRKAKAAAAAADNDAVFKRLAAPKSSRPFDPTPGEKVCMMYQSARIRRPVNFERLADISKPKKRPGRAESWGITRHHNPERQAFTPREHAEPPPQLPAAPASARQPGGAAPKASSVEKLPEVVDNRAAPQKQKQETTDEEYTDDYAEESDELAVARRVQDVPDRAVARRDQDAHVTSADRIASNSHSHSHSHSDHQAQGGAVAAAAANWSGQPPSHRLPLAMPTMSQDQEEDSDDDEEPFFPQFGLAGQRVAPPSREAVTTGAADQPASNAPFPHPGSPEARSVDGWPSGTGNEFGDMVGGAFACAAEVAATGGNAFVDMFGGAFAGAAEGAVEGGDRPSSRSGLLEDDLPLP